MLNQSLMQPSDPQLVSIDGVVYRKSLSSPKGGRACVGVALRAGSIVVINTNEGGPVVTFNEREWTAFLAGVKAGEFEIPLLPSSDQ